MRSRVGLSPTRPQLPAGSRIEPAPSEAGGRRAQAGRDRGRAAAARTGGAALGVPGISRDTERGSLGVAHDRQLGQVGLADHNRAGRPQAAHQLAVLARGREVGGGAPRRDLPGHVLGVLHRDRDAEQRPVVTARPPGVGLLRVGARAVSHDQPERVQLGVEASDPLEVQLDELTRRDLAAANELGLSYDSGEGKLVAVHGRGNLAAHRPRRRCESSGAGRPMEIGDHVGVVLAKGEMEAFESSSDALGDLGEGVALASRVKRPGRRSRLAHITATASAAIPSPRPTKPIPSLVVNLTLIASSPSPSASARRVRMASRCGASRGASQITVTSTLKGV